MPAPPPNGWSSTVRWTSVGVLAQVVECAGRAARSARALPSRLSEQNVVDELGEDGEHVDLHGLQAYEAMIFHIADTSTVGGLAGSRGTTRVRRAAIDLAEEGYIHCSTAEQWPAWSSGTTPTSTDLVLLHVDETVPDVSCWSTSSCPGAPEPFPHVYGPINLSAVVSAEPLNSAGL